MKGHRARLRVLGKPGVEAWIFVDGVRRMGDFDKAPALGYLYAAGYKAARLVAEDMGKRDGHSARRFPDPAAEARKRVVRSWDVALGPAEEEAVAQGIDDGLNGRRPRD